MHIDTTVRSCRGWGLLEIASYFGHASTVKSLWAAGIDSTDARNSSNYPVPGALSLQSLPLSVAARQGQLEVCKTLIQHAGSDPNFPAGSLNPLHVALENYHLDCVHFLVNSGADPEIPAQTLLQQASLEHNRLHSLTTKPEDEKAALFQEALTSGDLAAVEQLLRENADFNWKPTINRVRWSHMKNVIQCYLPISRRLIHALDAVDTEETAAATPGEQSFALQRAPETDYSATIEQLCRMEATLQDDMVKYGGYRVLQAASKGDHLEIVERLLQTGADVNAYVAACTQTVLHATAANGLSAIVERLIQAGEDPDIKAAYNYEGSRDPCGAARENGHLIVTERLSK